MTEQRKGNKYEIVETVDGNYMILVHGVQWGRVRDASGAGDDIFHTQQDARMKLADLYLEDQRIAREGKR